MNAFKYRFKLINIHENIFYKIWKIITQIDCLKYFWKATVKALDHIGPLVNACSTYFNWRRLIPRVIHKFTYLIFKISLFSWGDFDSRSLMDSSFDVLSFHFLYLIEIQLRRVKFWVSNKRTYLLMSLYLIYLKLNVFGAKFRR